MTILPFVEGNASDYNLVEDYASEDYDSEDYSNCTEAAPDSNLVESVYCDVLPDVLIDEYVPAHAAPTIEAENAIEQSVVVEAVEADATLESEIAVEDEEDTMSECSEEEEEDVTSECSEETWVESEEEDMISEGSEEASEDEAWVAGEDVMIEDSAQLYTPFEVGTSVAIEESAEGAVEAVTTMITIPAAMASTSLIPMWSSTVVEATGDSTVPTHDWEAFFGCSPMVMLQECRTALLTAVENFSLKWSDFGSVSAYLSTLCWASGRLLK